MNANQLPDVTPIVGEAINSRPKPGPLAAHWIVLAWDHKNGFWDLRPHFFIQRTAAEHEAQNLPNRFSWYRIVEIPADSE
jgi:hypothetical protein